MRYKLYRDIKQMPCVDGKYTAPDGWWCKIGNYAIISDDARIGDYARIGNYAIISDDARIGDYARIGNYAIMLQAVFA